MLFSPFSLMVDAVKSSIPLYSFVMLFLFFLPGLPKKKIQGLLPRNLDVDGRVAITNLNGTMKSRAEGSVRVLVLRPGGGGAKNPGICRWVGCGAVGRGGEGMVGGGIGEVYAGWGG